MSMLGTKKGDADPDSMGQRQRGTLIPRANGNKESKRNLTAAVQQLRPWPMPHSRQGSREPLLRHAGMCREMGELSVC